MVEKQDNSPLADIAVAPYREKSRPAQVPPEEARRALEHFEKYGLWGVENHATIEAALRHFAGENNEA